MYTTIKGEALFWIENGKKVVCRTLLTGHSGNGIVIASTAEEVVEAPLYTEFINKDKEFRVHVFNGAIIDFQQKKKRNGVEANGDIRNHGNGWVYARSDVTLPPLVAEQSIKAVSSLRLDFGAVDICTSLEGGVFVFEVNTAPGLEGTTLAKYVEAIKKYEESFNGR
jgi:glutathione synthase/RimK-type ligase-like ATP-grasp enzyme